MIVCAMIVAVSRLRDMADGSGRKLAAWTVGWYVGTTIITIIMSCIMTSLVWGPMFTEVSQDTLNKELSSGDQEKAAAGEETPPHIAVQTLFRSFITSNIFYSFSNDELLAILILAVVIGYLIPSKDSLVFRFVLELEQMIIRVITFLIKLAPVGVFFLVLSNLMQLKVEDVGYNLAILIAGTLSTMAIHVFIILPAMFFAFTRKNPYAFWIATSQAWITAWGSASSAATLPVTLRCAWKQKVPVTVYKFTCPLGCLINMDGYASYSCHLHIVCSLTDSFAALPSTFPWLSSSSRSLRAHTSALSTMS